MITIDENQEAVAQIRMFTNQFDEDHTQSEDIDDDDVNSDDEGPENSGDHYSLGSRSKALALSEVAKNNSTDPKFAHFASNLLEFLAENIPDEVRPSLNNNIIVSIILISLLCT